MCCCHALEGPCLLAGKVKKRSACELILLLYYHMININTATLCQPFCFQKELKNYRNCFVDFEIHHEMKVILASIFLPFDGGLPC